MARAPSYENQKLNYEDLSPEAVLCPDTFLEEIITPQDIFQHVLEDCQSLTMAVIDKDNSVKEQSCAFGMIFTESLSLTEQDLGTGELKISDWLGFLSDSVSPTVINPSEYPDNVFSSDAAADKNSDALPIQLLMDLNSMSGSVVQPDTSVEPSKRELNTKTEPANSEHGIARQVEDDCTQITSMLEPQLPVIQADMSKALTGFSLQRTAKEQLVSDHQKGKDIISNYWSATSNEKQTRKGSSHLVEAVLCAETAKTTSGSTMELRETSSISKIQKSAKNKQDPEISMSQEVSKDEGRKTDQRRRSKRIKDKMRQEVCHRSFTNPQCDVMLSRINKRNVYSKTLLYRAVAAEDLNHVYNIIKAGANVNDKDYAGWTALHEVSLEGHYQIANELLKAGADVNARGIKQITPLHNAVKEGHSKVAALLLHYGAEALLKNEMGRSALGEASDPCMRRLFKRHLARSGRHSVSGGDDEENTLSAQSTEDTNLHQVFLQTDESELARANLTDLGSADVLQETIENEMQNTFTNILGDGTSCTECALNINTETLLVWEPLAITSEASSSGSPNSADGALNTNEQKAQQPESGGRILFHAEESTERCHEKETKNVHSLEIFFKASQLHDKKIDQIKRKRQVLKDTNSKSDKGRFSEMGGREGTEKNKEGSGKCNMFLQFTEVEVQTKRLRIDPQETRQKTNLRSSIRKNKLSSACSKFSQASAQQTSKKSVKTEKRMKKNANGETKLHVAARRGNLSLVKTLISSGIPVNEQDNAGWTAIHEASAGGFTEVISELLKAGADVNSRGLGGILPIHDAVCTNSLEAARILLQHGANPCEKNDFGKSALDEADDDEMKELLMSYCSVEYGHVETSDVTVVEWNSCMSGRLSTTCFNCCENGGVSLEPQSEKYSVKSVAAMQDVEKKQKELLLLELRTSEDADVFTRDLSQIEATLNEIFAEQKAERDALAKKYRASAESCEKEPRRKEQEANLSFRQKNLLTVVQNQTKLLQKIENYRKSKQVFRPSVSEKQVMNPDIVVDAMRLGSSMPNENSVEAHFCSENRFSAQKCSQYPNNCLAETGANKEAVRNKVVSDSHSASENWIRKYYFSDMPTLPNARELVALPSKPAASTAQTKCLQHKDIDHIAVGEQGNKSSYHTSVTNALNISRAQGIVVSNNVCQTDSDCQQVLAYEDMHRYAHKKEAFQQHQQVVASEFADNFPNLHQELFQSCGNLCTADSMVTNFTSKTDYPVNLSKKCFQNYSYKESERKQRKYVRKNTKRKLQLIDLLEMGRIKPGENVLEFTLKEFSCKATLLADGKVKTSKNKIFQNPVEWVKDLLGSDIYVTWKYAWNKVLYCGTQLSKLVVEDAPISNDLEMPSQQRELGETLETFPCSEREAAEDLPVARELKSFSVQFNSAESPACFLQFTELLIVSAEEFLPWPEMEKHWNFYRACEKFGF